MVYNYDILINTCANICVERVWKKRSSNMYKQILKQKIKINRINFVKCF